MVLTLVVLLAVLTTVVLVVTVAALRNGLLIDEEMYRQLTRQIAHQRRMLLEPQAARVVIATRAHHR